MATTITRENLGAWLLRCNPKVWDLAAFRDAGGEWIDNWSVASNYRSRMMQPGDRVIFWVTGANPALPRGVWGSGYTVSDSYDEIPGDADAAEVGYWLDEGARLAVAQAIDVDIPLFDEPVTDRELKTAGISDLEVQIQPQISNPSWVSKEQLGRLDKLLPPWPAPADTEEEITVTKRGAGFGDPETNRKVEAAAIAAVTQFYELGGWTVRDVSADHVGWDLSCSHPSGDVARVEVKGVRGDKSVVLLTANEIRAAKTEDDWYLAVVTRALSDPTVTEFGGADAVQAARPYVYRAELPAALSPVPATASPDAQAASDLPRQARASAATADA